MVVIGNGVNGGPTNAVSGVGSPAVAEGGIDLVRPTENGVNAAAVQ